MEVTQKVVRNGKEYNADSGDKHCIPTHFNTELDVWYASLHTFSKVTVVMTREKRKKIEKQRTLDD